MLRKPVGKLPILKVRVVALRVSETVENMLFSRGRPKLTTALRGIYFENRLKRCKTKLFCKKLLPAVCE